jgi:hypothetical protein
MFPQPMFALALGARTDPLMLVLVCVNVVAS